jgi:NADH-quinone oxidoreductase subunit H
MDFYSIIGAIFSVLIFPGFLFAGCVGLALTWFDRKMTALIQSRQGPPWYQPFADIGKLLSKRMVIPGGSGSLTFTAAPLLALAGSTLSATIIFRAIINPQGGFLGDILVLLYLAMLPPIALIVGGSASRSPFGAIGASREMSMILAYEVGFLLAVLTVLVKVQSVRLGEILIYQSIHGPILFSVSGALGFLVALLCIQAKLGFLPFDIGEAETELIGGPLAEYSGAGLALFKLSTAISFVSLPVFLIALFIGPIGPSLVSWTGFGVKFGLLFLLIVVIKTTHARLRIDQALKFFWARLALVAAFGAGLAMLGW